MTRRLTPQGIFLLLSLIFGSLSAFVTAPFQVPDEAVHFYRAYSIAQGAFVPERDAGRVGDELPLSVIVSSNQLSRGLAGRPERNVDVELLVRELDRPLRPAAQNFEHYGQLPYSPVSYLPQSVAISIAASMDASPVEILYSARMATLVASSLLIFAGIRLLPFLKWAMALVALLPMSVFLRASASADAMTIALASLLFGAGMLVAFGESADRRRATAITLVAAFLVPLTKVIYGAVAAVALCARPGVFGSRARALAFYLSVTASVAAGVLASTIWSSAVIRSTVSTGTRGPLPTPIETPVATSSIIAREYVLRAPRYASHVIGRLGWLDTPLPLPVLACYALAILGLLVVSDATAPVRLWQRALALGAGAAILMMIGLTLYAGWTPAGFQHIEGIQGRYLLPAVPLAFVVTANSRFRRLLEREWFAPAFAVFNAAGLAVMIWVLFDRYYR
jgi:uncharacterized membrane protein